MDGLVLVSSDDSNQFYGQVLQSCLTGSWWAEWEAPVRAAQAEVETGTDPRLDTTEPQQDRTTSKVRLACGVKAWLST